MAPIFDFHCSACDKTFESLMRPYDPVSCPHCGNTHVDKKPCVAALHVWKTSVENPKHVINQEPKGKKK